MNDNSVCKEKDDDGAEVKTTPSSSKGKFSDNREENSSSTGREKSKGTEESEQSQSKEKQLQWEEGIYNYET